MSQEKERTIVFFAVVCGFASKINTQKSSAIQLGTSLLIKVHFPSIFNPQTDFIFFKWLQCFLLSLTNWGEGEKERKQDYYKQESEGTRETTSLFLKKMK